MNADPCGIQIWIHNTGVYRNRFTLRLKSYIYGYLARLLALLWNFSDYALSSCPWLSDDLSLWSSRRTSCWFCEKSWGRREQAAREIPPSPPPRSDNEHRCGIRGGNGCFRRIQIRQFRKFYYSTRLAWRKAGIFYTEICLAGKYLPTH